MIGPRQLLLHIVVALAALITIVVAPAWSYNVPGSAAYVIDDVGLVAANAQIDSLSRAASAALDDKRCTSGFDKVTYRQDCDWNIAIDGGGLFVSGSPNGFDYDARVGFGNFLVARQVTDDVSVFAGLLIERADVDTDFNSGGFEANGIGGEVGMTLVFSPVARFSILGGAEWLNYDVTRSGGVFNGSFDATRLFLDASLGGSSAGEKTWMNYRLGLRYITQDNSSYTEYNAGVPFAAIDGNRWSTLAATTDIRLGLALEDIRPFIEASGRVNLFDSNDLPSGLLANEEVVRLSGRLGAGVEANVANGMFTAGGGVHFGDGDYRGFDVLAGFRLDF